VYTVTFAVKALAQSRLIEHWWRDHRPSAPDLFTDELARAVQLLAVTPAIGPPYREEPRYEVRRLVLRRTKCAVFYQVDDASLEISIVAIQHAARGRRPRL
jgi:plasmid stabilization system protein ParE